MLPKINHFFNIEETDVALQIAVARSLGLEICSDESHIDQLVLQYDVDPLVEKLRPLVDDDNLSFFKHCLSQCQAPSVELLQVLRGIHPGWNRKCQMKLLALVVRVYGNQWEEPGVDSPVRVFLVNDGIALGMVAFMGVFPAHSLSPLYLLS